MKKLLLGLGLLAATGAPALADGAAPGWTPYFAPPTYYHPPGVKQVQPFPIPRSGRSTPAVRSVPVSPIWSRPAQPQPTGPMRVIIVRSSTSDCGDHCATWISSPGGRVQASLAIGRMIRAKGLDVIVSRTTLTPCPDNDKACADNELAGRTGTPMSLTSYCASACANILAAGTRRIVSPRYPLVGVHDMTVTRNWRTIEKIPTYNPFGHFTGYRTKIINDGPGLKEPADPTQYRIFTSYFKGMGIKGDMIGLMHMATPDQIHWMSSQELSDTGLATERMTSEDYMAAIDHTGSSPPIAPQGGTLAYAPASTVPAIRICPLVPASLSRFASLMQVRVELPPSFVAAPTMLAKEASNVGFPLNPQYLRYAATVVTTVSGTPPQTFVAVVPLGRYVWTGDVVTMVARHLDLTSPCSFAPNLLLLPVDQAPIAKSGPAASTPQALAATPPPKLAPSAIVCSSPPKTLPLSAAEVQARVELPTSFSGASSLLSKEESNVGFPVNPQYRGYGVTVVTTLSDTPPQTLLAVVPPTVSAHVGDTVVLLTRHKDSDPSCSFTPNLVLSARHL